MTNPAITPVESALVDKVRKLLTMAERTSNSNEADAFSRKAAELIADHRISPDQLRERGSGDLAIEEFELGRGAYVRGRLALLQAVAEPNGCQVVFQARSAGTVAFVAGFRSDLDTVGLLYHSLHAQASSRLASERRATAAATQQFRRSFLFGYADEIRTMLDQTARDATERLHPSSTALPVLRARERRVDEFARRRFGRVVAARRPKGATPQGFFAGRQAASRADLGRKRVVGLPALGRGA
jgi:transposase